MALFTNIHASEGHGLFQRALLSRCSGVLSLIGFCCKDSFHDGPGLNRHLSYGFFHKHTWWSLSKGSFSTMLRASVVCWSLLYGFFSRRVVQVSNRLLFTHVGLFYMAYFTFSEALRVKFLLKTDSGYPMDTRVNLSSSPP